MQSNYTKHLQAGHQSDLVVGAMRPQRDLFSGSSLGIPDVNTHVGSVVHAFESLATQQQRKKTSGERQQKSMAPQPPKPNTEMIGHKIALPSGGLVEQFASYVVEKSGDESGMSNLDTLSYKIDNNYRKSGFGVQPTTSSSKASPSEKQHQQQQHHYTVKRNMPAVAGSTQLAAIDHRKFNNIGYTSAAVQETSQSYDNDFIRGSTVSQSFIKNVKTSKSGSRKSVYEQNVTKIMKHPVVPPKPVPRAERRIKARSAPVDEVSQRYTEHSGDFRRASERRKTFAPAIRNRAEI